MAFIGQTTIDFSQFPPNTVLQPVDCDASVYVGAWVRMTSLGIAVNALADSIVNSNVIGVCEAKLSATSCVVRFLGQTSDIFSGLDVTKEYFLSDTVAGDMTTTPPTASTHIVLKVGQPFSALSFVVLKGIRMERA